MESDLGKAPSSDKVNKGETTVTDIEDSEDTVTSKSYQMSDKCVDDSVSPQNKKQKLDKTETQAGERTSDKMESQTGEGTSDIDHKPATALNRY